MKKIIVCLISILVLGTSFQEQAIAQKKDPVQPVGCIDAIIRAQAVDIRDHYTSQGFIVYRDAMINMSSMEPFPIMVQLSRGQLYQIIFVGQSAATNHKMVLYDGADNKIDEKFISRSKSTGTEPTNYLIYEFVPDRTDMYLLTFMSRLKNKSFCGSVCIVAADRSKGKIQYKPFVP